MMIGLTEAWADRAADLARIHIEAIGGRERIEALAALRAHGMVIAGGQLVRFTMIAARPDRVRLETQAGGRTLVQATDGKEPPWEFDTGTWPPRYRDMAESNVKIFTADAEFDDPLVAGEKRGFTFDFAGEVNVDGRKFLRLLATRKLRETYSLLLDPDTYLISFRIEQRKTPGGRPMQIATRFDDFRPVKGVLLPHEVTLIVDGKGTQQTKIERIDPNPQITAETFTRPKSTAKAPAANEKE
ncbi:MAG: hypothetical protein Q7S40_23660 [Opitutaceae bacterium]|nr:hypothetical protein [Opitutaceae bacterium]